MSAQPESDEFERFFMHAEPRLRRAYTGALEPARVGDAVGSALEFAWRNWDRVSTMQHRVAYLYRVGLSKSRPRKQGALPAAPPAELTIVEPSLIPAMQRLPRRQLEAVWLIDACGWTPTEASDALGLSLSAVRTHRSRGIERLRAHMGVSSDA